MNKGTMFDIRVGTKFWYNRTEDEIKDLRLIDIAAGNFLDSAGEPILYSSVGSGYIEQDCSAYVLRARGVQWNDWRNKPKGLIEVCVNLDGVRANAYLFMRKGDSWANEKIIMICKKSIVQSV
jgi:hypothetical protein